eukprot:1703272-Alexandrium_andersonii.AAC.1
MGAPGVPPQRPPAHPGSQCTLARCPGTCGHRGCHDGRARVAPRRPYVPGYQPDEPLCPAEAAA